MDDRWSDGGVGFRVEVEQMSSLIERRRAPRMVLQFEEAIGIELRHRARFMDISLNGALLACDVKCQSGPAKLRAGLHHRRGGNRRPAAR